MGRTNERKTENRILNLEEERLLKRYRSLTLQGRAMALGILSNISQYETEEERPAATQEPPFFHSAGRRIRSIPVYAMPVSAGTGQFLENGDYAMEEAGDEVPARASFGVRIAGDSMEPFFSDGEIAWVEKCGAVQNGQIGIFLLNGDAYIKKLHERGGCFRSFL